MDFNAQDLCAFELVMHALYGTDAERESCTAEIFCRIATDYTPIEFDIFTNELENFLMDYLKGRKHLKRV